jgi:hypothetical protein
MKAPESPWGQFGFFFIAEFFSCLVIVANTRAFTLADYGWTAITEAVWGAQTFILWKLMFDDERCRTWAAGAGMVLGSVAGAELSIFITKRLFGA